jgi:hypothetical protein
VTVEEFTSKFNTVRTEFNLYYKDKELVGPLCAYANSEVICVRYYYIKTQAEDISGVYGIQYCCPFKHTLVLDVEIGDTEALTTPKPV